MLITGVTDQHDDGYCISRRFFISTHPSPPVTTIAAVAIKPGSAHPCSSMSAFVNKGGMADYL